MLYRVIVTMSNREYFKYAKARQKSPDKSHRTVFSNDLRFGLRYFRIHVFTHALHD